MERHFGSDRLIFLVSWVAFFQAVRLRQSLYLTRARSSAKMIESLCEPMVLLAILQTAISSARQPLFRPKGL